MEKVGAVGVVFIVALFSVAMVVFWVEPNNPKDSPRSITSSPQSCGHEAEIEALRMQIVDLEDRNAKLIAEVKLQKATITSLENALHESRIHADALRNENDAFRNEYRPDIGIKCPITGISIEDQSKATAVFMEVMRGVSGDDLDSGNGFNERTHTAYNTLVAFWGGNEEKLKGAILMAKDAVRLALGPPPYDVNYMRWAAMPANKFAAALFDRYGHLELR
mgnify:CR=1 FL=1